MCRLRRAISREAGLCAARAAAELVLSLPELESARAVGLYAALPGELSTDELAEALRQRGVVVAYPRIVPGTRALCFHRVADPAAMIAGPFGITQPAADAPEIAVVELDLLVVPGLAFDLHGGRLGWGKGFYDTTLATPGGPLRVGFAHACQIVEAVPCMAHDVPMDIVVSDTGILRVREPNSPPAPSSSQPQRGARDRREEPPA